jgi:hypothetical protein
MDYKFTGEAQEISGNELSFSNIELFQKLYFSVGGQNICPHTGDIHILYILANKDFEDIYTWLFNYYSSTI